MSETEGRLHIVEKRALDLRLKVLVSFWVLEQVMSPL